MYLVLIFIVSNNQNKTFMEHLSNFLLVWQLVLFIIIMGNIARLLSDYLITKIK